MLPKGFRIVVGEKAQPWVKYAGGGTLLVHRWSPQTIVVGNSGNVDAYGVVLWVAVPNDPDFDILFLNLDVKKPQQAIDNGWSDELDAIGLSQVVDSLFGKPSDSRLYSFYLPYVPAKSSLNISVRVRTKLPVRNDIQVAVSAPFLLHHFHLMFKVVLPLQQQKLVSKPGWALSLAFLVSPANWDLF